MEANGSIILEILNNSISKWPVQEGRFLQVSGVKFSFNPDKPEGSRIIEESVFIGGKLLDKVKLYTFASTEFLAAGHDGFGACSKAEMIIDGENGPEIKTILHEFFNLSNEEQYRKELRLTRTDYKSYVKNDIKRDVECLIRRKVKMVKHMNKFHGNN